MSTQYTQYTWVLVLGSIASFIVAYGIGANDFANSFGTSVGAKTLTLAQAAALAAVFEFSGSMLLGGNVAKTVSSRILNVGDFGRRPEVLMYGMFCSLIASGAWLLLATYYELPVSTTQTTIGAVLGFALVYGGSSAVNWASSIDSFPYVEGVVPIFISWVTSPIVTGAVALLWFSLVRSVILRSERSVELAVWLFPVLVLVTAYVNVLLVLDKGAANKLHLGIARSAWIAAIVAVSAGLLCAVVVVPFLRKSIFLDVHDRHMNEAPDYVQGKEKDQAEDNEHVTPGYKKVWKKVVDIAMHGVRVDIHEVVDAEVALVAIHQKAEQFNPATESAFKYLQVMSAICDSFVHGANDVANAAGPLALMWFVYNDYGVDEDIQEPYWILAIGATGIVVGLWTYGYNMCRVLGVKLSAITPSRGFCIELSTSFVIVLCTHFGLPISSTYCQVGAVVGLGLADGYTGVNWRLFFVCVLGWVATILVPGLLSAAWFVQGALSPSIYTGKQIQGYEDNIQVLSLNLYKYMNRSLHSWYTTTLFDHADNATLQASYAACQHLITAPSGKNKLMPVQTVASGDMLRDCLFNSMQL